MREPTRIFSPATSFHSFLVFTGLLILIGLGVEHTRPPNFPELMGFSGSFSATRAMNHVWRIGKQPHPTGTPENEEVRAYIVSQLKGMGFAPDIQSAGAVNAGRGFTGTIHNIVVKIPGKRPGKALMLVAHYDSVPTGPGAADDGASVAAILETLRALKNLPQLENDLLCLFTDGEETTGLLGAKSFIDRYPLAKTIGLALNFEYRGNHGAFMMFETSANNGALIQGLSHSVSFILANSLMYEVYKRLPNDTDFSVFKRAGIPGMNFAAIEGLDAYHTPLDRPEMLDQRTLQHEGDIMLGLTRYFGNLPLTRQVGLDRVYFDLPLLGFVHYPVVWLAPMSGLLALLLGALTFKGVKQGTLHRDGMLLGTVVFPVIVLVLAGTNQLIWFAIQSLYPVTHPFVQNQRVIYGNGWGLIAFVLITISLFGGLQKWICRWLEPWDFSFGIMMVWLILALLSAIWLPGASFILLWPLTGMLIAVGWLFFFAHNRVVPALVLPMLVLGVVPAFFIFIPLIRLLYIALTPSLIAVDVAFLVLFLGLLVPLMESTRWRGIWFVACFVFGVVALISGFEVADVSRAIGM